MKAIFTPSGDKSRGMSPGRRRQRDGLSSLSSGSTRFLKCLRYNHPTGQDGKGKTCLSILTFQVNEHDGQGALWWGVARAAEKCNL